MIKKIKYLYNILSIHGFNLKKIINLYSNYE